MNALFFKLIIRKLSRNISFTVIKIFGLSVGLACSIVISLWILTEIRYDKSINNSENKFRLMSYGQNYWRNGVIWSPGPFAPIAVESLPNIEKSLRIFPVFSRMAFKYNNKKFYEGEGIFADSSFLSFFNIKLKHGSYSSCFEKTNSIIASSKFAKRYFGNSNPLGKIIQTDNDLFVVTGVMEPTPETLSIKVNFILPISKLEPFNNWSNINVITYFQTKDLASSENLSEDLTKIVREKKSIQYQRDSAFFKLQPVSDIHLDSEHGSYLGIYDLGNKKFLIIFSTVAIFILVLAIINFINLHTANTENIKKEILIKTAVGASRKNLIRFQYFESLIIIFCAFTIAILLVKLLLNKSYYLIDKQISINNIFDIKLILGLIILFITTWIISGTYPAFYLSSLSKNLYSKFNWRPKFVLIKILVVIQFFVTITLLISFLTILRQVTYIKNKDLGFNTGNILYFPMKGEFASNYETLKKKLLQCDKIQYVSNQDYLWASLNNRTTGLKWDGKDPNTNIEMHIPQVGFDFIETLNIKLLEGESYNERYALDSNAYILNSSAVKKMSLKDPVGSMLSIYTGAKWEHGKVIGIINDINFKSLKTEIEPMVLRFLKSPKSNTNYGVVLVKYNDSETKYAAKVIEDLWNHVNPNIPFEYKLLEDTYNGFYNEDHKTFKFITFFVLLTILISCVGLSGLISFTIQQKDKEIGIRKVVGAHASNIIVILVNDFIKLVIISYVLAVPVSYYFMDKWLQEFAYKIKFDIVICIYALTIIILITLLSIIYKSVITARRNPIEILRYE